MLAGTEKTVLEKVQVLMQNPFSTVANEYDAYNQDNWSSLLGWSLTNATATY